MQVCVSVHIVCAHVWMCWATVTGLEIAGSLAAMHLPCKAYRYKDRSRDPLLLNLGYLPEFCQLWTHMYDNNHKHILAHDKKYVKQLSVAFTHKHPLLDD